MIWMIGFFVLLLAVIILVVINYTNVFKSEEPAATEEIVV